MSSLKQQHDLKNRSLRKLSLYGIFFNLLVFIEVLIVQWWRHTETVYIVKLFSGQAVQKLFVTSIYFFPRRKKTKTTQICFLQHDRAIMCTGQMLWNDGALSLIWLARSHVW